MSIMLLGDYDMKKLVCVVLCFAMLVCGICTVSANAKRLTKTIEKDDLIQIGDFDSLFDGFFVLCPKALAESEGRFPVVVWANGTMCPPVLYTKLLREIAKSGYIVVASPEMMPKDGKEQIAAIDYIISENADKDSLFYNKVDTEKIGAVGHSQGGASTVNAAAADNRIKAVVSIAGASRKDEAAVLKVPTLFFTGKLDFVVFSPWWTKPSYNACNVPAVYASLKLGIHTSCIFNADAYIGYTVKWLNTWLFGSNDKSVFLPGGSLSADCNWTDFQVKNFS